jgi:1,4-dihydroxy-2-naphthoyl-CoA hydrolase
VLDFDVTRSDARADRMAAGASSSSNEAATSRARTPPIRSAIPTNGPAAYFAVVAESESEHRPGAGDEELLRAMPFAVAVGIALDSAAAEEVRGRLAWSPERCTAGGVLHGGALMALADSLGGICAYLNLPPGAQTSTISSTTTFVRAVRAGEVTAVARPLHAGRTVIVVQADMHDDSGRRVAQVTQTQAVHGAGPSS